MKVQPPRDYTDETVLLCPKIRALPIVHGSVEYTVLIRKIFLHSPPAMLATELPEHMGDRLEEALPYGDQIPILSLEAESGEIHFIMEPMEPIVEALRSAYETETPRRLIDSKNEIFPIWTHEKFPDTYSLNFMSSSEMYKIYQTERKKNQEQHDDIDQLINQIDDLREIHMARQLRMQSQFMEPSEDLRKCILFVGGIKHISGIKRYLNMNQEDFDAACTRLDQVNQALSNSGEELNDRSQEEPLEALLNEQLQTSEREARNASINISILSAESPEVLELPGYYNAAWNLARHNLPAIENFHRVLLNRSAYRECVNRYERESGELFPPQIEKLFFRFARNWSITEGKLLPDGYRMVQSARGFGSDNFARIMYHTLYYLPPVPNPAFPERKLTLDDMYKNSRMIRFRLKMKIKRKVPPPRILKQFEKEKYPGEWRDQWDHQGICSHQPEDIMVEDFGRYLQEKARTLMKGSETKTVPFSSSLLDGIDYRETIRNYHLGKIFVKDEVIRGLEAGSVVVIFNEDDTEHNWKMVWWGEHAQESDMAFYSTMPGDKIVGPGICQCRYGGFMLTYPPGRLHDIWSDEFYGDFTNPADRLLASAIEYNEKKVVVHLSDRAPHPKLQQIAGRMGQKIIHIPISTINSVKLGRMRRFHVLDSKDRRGDADNFIW